MIKLDEDLLNELGLSALPADEKRNLLAHMYETLEKEFGERLASQMSPEQLQDFEQFVRQEDESGALQWLESNLPNYKDVVADEFEKLKTEVRGFVPQILASAQSQAQAQFQQSDLQAPQPQISQQWQQPAQSQPVPTQPEPVMWAQQPVMNTAPEAMPAGYPQPQQGYAPVAQQQWPTPPVAPMPSQGGYPPAAPQMSTPVQQPFVDPRNMQNYGATTTPATPLQPAQPMHPGAPQQQYTQNSGQTTPQQFMQSPAPQVDEGDYQNPEALRAD